MTEQDPNFFVGDNDHGDAVPTTVADIVKQLTDDNIMLRREIKDLKEQVKVINECLDVRQNNLLIEKCRQLEMERDEAGKR